MSAAVSGDYVAGVLRDMYGGGALPRAATQLLRDHSKARSSSAPPARSWSASVSENRPGRKRVDLKVPRVGRGRGAGSEVQALPPRMPGRRSHAAIVKETSNYVRLDERPQQLGRDNDAERQWLADQRYFGAAMGRRAASEAPASARRVSFESVPSGAEPAPRRAGLDGEQERLAAEIVAGVRERQRELDGVERDLASYAARAEEPGVGYERRAAARKQLDSANKVRLELRNAISRDVADLGTLMDCTQCG